MVDEISNEELQGLRWSANLYRDVRGAPLLSPRYVAEHCGHLQLVDLRDPERALLATGFIPGSVFSEMLVLENYARDHPQLELVLVSERGDSAADLALQLERRGIERVAAIAGGIAGWRELGLGTSRDTRSVRSDFADAEVNVPSTNGPMTAEQLAAHIGDYRTIRWIRMVSLATHARCACIDGRDGRGVVGTPGGDAGEFVLAMAAIEQASGVTLSDADIRAAMLVRADNFGEFYMHTDQAAFKAFSEALHGDTRFDAALAGVHDLVAWAQFLDRPPEILRQPLLDYLLDPAHIGCGHLRLMLQHADEYRVRAELVRGVLRSFYELKWDGASEMTMTLLAGSHAESAVVNIRLDEQLWELSLIPLISPLRHGRQIFVNHPQVAARLRDLMIDANLRGYGPVRVADRSKLEAAFSELGALHLGNTVARLAKGLPVFDVLFASDGSYTVSAA